MNACIERLHVTSSPIPMHVNFHVSSLPHSKQDSRTNVCHTWATVTALLKFLYIWMPLHMIYITAVLVCEKFRRQPYKVSDWVWICHAEVNVIAVALLMSVIIYIAGLYSQGSPFICTRPFLVLGGFGLTVCASHNIISQYAHTMEHNYIAKLLVWYTSNLITYYYVLCTLCTAEAYMVLLRAVGDSPPSW